MICPTCNEQNQDSAMFCLNCGTELTSLSEPNDNGAAQQRPVPGIAPFPDSPDPTPISKPGAKAIPLPKNGADSARIDSSILDKIAKVRPITEPIPLPDESVSANASNQGFDGHAQRKPRTTVPMPPTIIVSSDNEQKAADYRQQPETSPKECHMCGAPATSENTFCGQCGMPVNKKDLPQISIASSSAKARLSQLNLEGQVDNSYGIDDLGLKVNCSNGNVCTGEIDSSEPHVIFRTDNDLVIMTTPNTDKQVFVRIPPKQPVEIQPGKLLRFGQQLMLFETEASLFPGAWGQVTNISADGSEDIYPLENNEVIFGRNNGDIVFPEDQHASGSHLRLYKDKDKTFLFDLESTNGTYLQLEGSYQTNNNDIFLIGKKIYRADAN